MAGGLRVGDLYIVASASIGQALKSLGDLVEGVEKAAKEVKKAAKDIGEIGAIVAAGIAGAVIAASESNAEMKEEVTRIKDLLYTLAADIGDLFAPVVKRLADFVERLVATFQRLSPETKEAAANLATWVAGAGLAVGAIGKMAGVIEALSGGVGLLIRTLGMLSSSTALAGLGATLAGLALPVAAVAAGVAAVVLLSGRVYEAWTDASSGLRDSVMGILSSIGGLAQKLWALLKSTFETLTNIIQAVVLDALNTMAWLIRTVAKSLLGLTSALPKTMQMGNLNKALTTASGLSGKDLLDAGLGVGSAVKDAIVSGGQQVGEAISTFVSDVLDKGRQLKDSAGREWEKTMSGTKKMFADMGLTGLFESLMKLLPSLSDGGATIRGRGGDGKDGGSAQLLREMGEANARMMAQSADFEAQLAKESFDRFQREVAALNDEERMNLEMAAQDREDLVTSERAALYAGAQSFNSIADEARRMAAEAKHAIESVRESLIGRVMGSLSNLGSIIQNAAQHFMVGDVMGGVASVITDLLLQSEGFQVLMQMVSTIIQRVADALGSILTPLQPLLGAVSLIIDALMTAITPIFEMLGEALKPLVPPLVIIGQLLQGLAPLFEVLMKAFVVLSLPLKLLGGPVMKGLFEVLKWVSTVILYVAMAIGSVWNAIVSAVQAVIRAISSMVDWLGIDALNDFARDLEDLKVDTDAMSDALDTLTDTTWDSADATAENAAETLRNTDALRRANEALTNVPSAWRVALRRFQVQDNQEGPTVEPTPTPGTGGGKTPLPGVGGGSGGSPGNPVVDGFREVVRNLGEMYPDRNGVTDVLDRFTHALDGLLYRTAPESPNTPDDAKAGASFVFNIQGTDITQAMEEAQRFAERQRNLVGFRGTGRTSRLTPKFG